MSALNWSLQPEYVCLVADTLVSSADSAREPLFYTSKVFPVPHLDGVVCGTGLYGLILDWFLTVNTGIVARSMSRLDEQVPDLLRTLWKRQIGSPLWRMNQSAITATVYHFGYDDKEKRFRGWAYRSTNRFTSEELAYGCGIKPATQYQFPEDFALPNEFITLTEQQRQEDLARPAAERVGIGGDLHFHYLRCAEDGPVLYECRRCHRFPDYEELGQSMLDRAKQGSGAVGERGVERKIHGTR